MNRIVIIGNGFDLAHKLKTSYREFIFWYMHDVMINLFQHHKIDESDKLITFKQSKQFKNTRFNDYKEIIEEAYNNNYISYSNNPLTMLRELGIPGNIKVIPSDFMKKITMNIESKGWTDIESDYYELLKENKNDIETCKSLNEQLDHLKELLCEYLKDMTADKANEFITEAINDKIQCDEIATGSKLLVHEHIPNDIRPENQQKTLDELYTIKDVLLLNFNYTATADMYSGRYNDCTEVKVCHIHGSLDKTDQIIFGYGDEMDNNFSELVDLNENELLKNSKSIKYLETNNYKKLLQFMEGGAFQVLIMGHSCGNSDRTLLNTIFEHKNCVSIKPFCYIDEKGEDNYSELTRNIYRNFKDKTLFRDRVVDKSLCYTLDGHKLYKHNE